MRRDFVYPLTLTPDNEEGGFVVTMPDLPEVITQGEDERDALEQAADALDEALAGRIRRGDEIPRPSPRGQGQRAVIPTPRFLARVDSARRSLRAGRGVRLEDVPE